MFERLKKFIREYPDIKKLKKENGILKNENYKFKRMIILIGRKNHV